MNKDRFIVEVTEEQIKREKARARELRKSSWWKRKLQEGTCYYCGRKFKPSELTMDHLIPLIRGGRSVKSNLVTACKECNTKKKYLLPFEWEEYLKKLNNCYLRHQEEVEI
jgi:5-methylcytosine-specific restriction protein A